MDKRLCDVCERMTDKPIVACSSLCAMTLCYCPKCAEIGAEPLGVLSATDEICGGDVVEWILDTLTWIGVGYALYREVRGQVTA